MTWPTLLLLSLALATDAFAVALVSAIQLRTPTIAQSVRLSFSFGLFQGVMLVLGWWAGQKAQAIIAPVDHWVAFGLLAFAGGKMIRSAFHVGDAPKDPTDPTTGMHLLMLSVATSIDAMAIGLSLSILRWSIATPALVVGSVAAVLTLAGMRLGARLGTRWAGRFELIGGMVLIGIGIKIVLEHML